MSAQEVAEAARKSHEDGLLYRQLSESARGKAPEEKPPAQLNFYQKVQKVQERMKAPKNLYNSFGKYNYRNAESILEAFKPYGAEYGLLLTVSDDIYQVGDRFYVKATAYLQSTSGSGSLAVSASAREAETKAGMDPAQITGSASSYARKYALNGLFLLDDTKDPDSEEQARQAEKEKPAAKKPAPAKEERKPKAPDDKIGQLEAAALRRELTRTGVSEWSMLKSYGVDSIESMTREQWADAGEILASKPDREVKG